MLLEAFKSRKWYWLYLFHSEVARLLHSFLIRNPLEKFSYAIKIFPIMGVSYNFRISRFFLIQSLKKYLPPPTFLYALKLLFSYQGIKTSCIFAVCDNVTIPSEDHADRAEPAGGSCLLRAWDGYSAWWALGTSATGQQVSCGYWSCMWSTDEGALACFYIHCVASAVKICLDQLN